ncbi:MAG TPA: hypothetical protein VH643_33100 [Gemmataceae bacterium]|jgi:hypothetical protein
MKRLVLFTMLGVCFLQGCDRRLDKAADADEGAKALQTALQAWKSGKLPEDLREVKPSIVMNEDEWRVGKRLLDFKVEEIALSGRQIRATVQIKLEDKSGKTRDQKAIYIVDTTPRIVIVRDTFAL